MTATENERFLRDLEEIAAALHRIGLGNASAGGRGALELLSKEVKEYGERVAGALSELAEAIKYPERPPLTGMAAYLWQFEGKLVAVKAHGVQYNGYLAYVLSDALIIDDPDAGMPELQVIPCSTIELVEVLK